MPSLLCLVIDRSPYGSIEPAEAIRHAAAALGKGWEVVLAFMGLSVYTALRGQSPPAGEWLSLSAALTKLLDDGKGRARVLVDGHALDAGGLVAGSLIPGVGRASPVENCTRPDRMRPDVTCLRAPMASILVVLSSSPETPAGRHALKLAESLAAEGHALTLCCRQDAALLGSDRAPAEARAVLDDFPGRGARCLVLGEDLLLRCSGAGERALTVDYAGLIAALTAEHDRVVGAI